jgi:circadian clock protein KaiC
VPTGIDRLDSMLGGGGYYRGSSVLVSGTAGSGKSTLSAHFADATCRRGERCLYLAFEESKDQIVRNMRSVGIELEHWVREGLLRIEASRPSTHGVEMHLTHIHRLLETFQPHAVVVDPISNLSNASSEADAAAMLLRLVDHLKSKGITAMLVNLTSGGNVTEATDVGISSLIDTWLVLRDIELGGERNRGLYVIKSRGMKHSNQIREFLITSDGIRLEDVYVGPEGVLTGSMRASLEARERALAVARDREALRRRRDIERRRAALHAQIVALQGEAMAMDEEAAILAEQAETETRDAQQQRESAARRRGEPIEE